MDTIEMHTKVFIGNPEGKRSPWKTKIYIRG
jgi:hypothetical protein